MRILSTIICSTIFSTFSFSQNIDYAYFELTQDCTNIQSVVIQSDDVTFKINQNGSDFEFTLNTYQYKREDYYDYVDPGLDFIGRNSNVEYYTNTFDDNLKDRVKKINNLNISYFDRFSMYNSGKIKGIGNISFEYYDAFDWGKLEGRIKKIGSYKIVYYDRFASSELEGKIKSIGDVTLEYYTKYENQGKSGKLKRTKGNTKTMLVMPAPSRISF